MTLHLRRRTNWLLAGTLSLGTLGCSGAAREPSSAAGPQPKAPSPSEGVSNAAPGSLQQQFADWALTADAKLAPDPTNRFADDPRAAKLGQQFFFDPRFSGPLLDTVNDGSSQTLGKVGETGKVACVGCHMAHNRAFVDTRSPRAQLSLASGWTHRKAPSLLDVGHSKLLMWDGRHDTFFGQVLTPIESPLEFNSSRLFVAQQVERYYAAEYRELFGPLPDLSTFASLNPRNAGCSKLPADPVEQRCFKPGHDDEGVLGVVANFGKAIEAYLRRLSCGSGRFDAWVGGDKTALNETERAGAALFMGKAGCAKCHVGAYFTDRRFYDLGLRGALIPFTGVNSQGDVGAARGMKKLMSDPLNSKGRFSDGDDGRLSLLPKNPDMLTNAFRTPGLRCVSRRPSFMHDGRYRSLLDVVDFFTQHGRLDLVPEEQHQLVLFLEALDGSGPSPETLVSPRLPGVRSTDGATDDIVSEQKSLPQ